MPDPPVMVPGLRVHDRLVELVVTSRLTVPANPLIGVTTIVEVPATPAFKVTLPGLADIVKSWTWYATVAERDMTPLVPVTVAK